MSLWARLARRLRQRGRRTPRNLCAACSSRHRIPVVIERWDRDPQKSPPVMAPEFNPTAPYPRCPVCRKTVTIFKEWRKSLAHDRLERMRELGFSGTPHFARRHHTNRPQAP